MKRKGKIFFLNKKIKGRMGGGGGDFNLILEEGRGQEGGGERGGGYFSSNDKTLGISSVCT